GAPRNTDIISNIELPSDGTITVVVMGPIRPRFNEVFFLPWERVRIGIITITPDGRERQMGFAAHLDGDVRSKPVSIEILKIDVLRRSPFASAVLPGEAIDASLHAIPTHAAFACRHVFDAQAPLVGRPSTIIIVPPRASVALARRDAAV